MKVTSADVVEFHKNHTYGSRDLVPVSGDHETAGGKKIDLFFYGDNPCLSCGLPVGAMSAGGVETCPACDCGNKRDGAMRETGCWTIHIGFGPCFCVKCGLYRIFKVERRDVDEIEQSGRLIIGPWVAQCETCLSDVAYRLFKPINLWDR